MSNRREFIQAAGIAATGLLATANPPALAAAALAPGDSSSARTKGAKFRELLKGSETFESISVQDVLAARMTEMMGFRSLMLGSSAVSEALGVPDWSIASDTERIEFYGRIADSVNIPSFADLDEGGFTPLTLYRSTKAYERAASGPFTSVMEKPSGAPAPACFPSRR
jgi:hypothetical protein